MTPEQRQEFAKYLPLAVPIIIFLGLLLAYLPTVLSWMGISISALPFELILIVFVLALIIIWSYNFKRENKASPAEFLQDIGYQKIHREGTATQAPYGVWIFSGIIALVMLGVGVNALWAGLTRAPEATPFALFVPLAIFILWGATIASAQQKIEAENRYGTPESQSVTSEYYNQSKRFFFRALIVALFIATLWTALFPIPWERGTFSTQPESPQNINLRLAMTEAIQKGNTSTIIPIEPNSYLDAAWLAEQASRQLKREGEINNSVSVCLLSDRLANQADFSVRPARITYNGSEPQQVKIEVECFRDNFWPAGIWQTENFEKKDVSGCRATNQHCPNGTARCCAVLPLLWNPLNGAKN
jgi:hypothetical protein